MIVFVHVLTRLVPVEVAGIGGVFLVCRTLDLHSRTGPTDDEEGSSAERCRASPAHTSAVRSLQHRTGFQIPLREVLVLPATADHRRRLR
ncbi:hypothetical protein AB0H37_10650 [Actinomadura sp. NPDC023710]|uniref:hypothetical protein n=1 Tax=Actinomadura sp. NPDC023710 TaxID=3158219 RepID=UPI0033CC7BEA